MKFNKACSQLPAHAKISHVLNTVKCSSTVLYCFQSRQDYCGGSCLFHDYPFCEVTVHGNYVHLALILDKGF